MLTITLMNIEKLRLRTFFMDNYLFCKSYLLLSKGVLVLSYFCMDVTLKVLRSKYGGKIRLDIKQVRFSKEFFKHAENFTATLFQNTILWLVP